MGQGAPALRPIHPQNLQTKKQVKEAEKKRKALEKEAHKQNLSTGQYLTQQKAQATAPTQVAETPQQEYARIAQTLAQKQQLAREAGAKEAQAVRTGLQNAQGFSPEQARLMQYEAHKGIQRQEQAAQRNLVGEQGTRGIGGRSGIAYAQRRDMNQAYAGQHQQAQSDYNRLNEAQRFANFGAEYGAGKGEEARFGTDWQEEQEKEARKKYQLANPNFGKETYQFMKMG
jgi:hypothetical protein